MLFQTSRFDLPDKVSTLFAFKIKKKKIISLFKIRSKIVTVKHKL